MAQEDWKTHTEFVASLFAILGVLGALLVTCKKLCTNLWRFLVLFLKMPSSMESLLVLLEETKVLSEARHRMIMSHVGIASWESRIDGSCELASEDLAELMGCEISEILNFGWVNAVHPDDRERVAKLWESAVHTRSRFYANYRYVHKNGTIVAISATAVPAMNARGEVVHAHDGL